MSGAGNYGGNSLLAPLASSSPVALTGQSFRTISVPNYQPCLYTLSIRQPGIGAADYLTYTFPLSPESVRKVWTEMTAIYDSPGTPVQNGVNREADIFGSAPPTFLIEGTTGWQRHMTDGFLYTGLQSLLALEKFFQTFTQLNQTLLASGQTTLFTMEFYDYFKGDYYQVVPTGEQQIIQLASKPLLLNYSLRLTALRRINAPTIGLLDALANVFGSPATAAAANVANASLNFINVYTPDGIAGSGTTSVTAPTQQAALNLAATEPTGTTVYYPVP